VAGTSSASDRQTQVAPWVWRPGDLRPDEWCRTLTPAQRGAIVAAARAAVAAGHTPVTLPADGFPLPALADALAEWSGALADGRGFLLLRGFPIDELTPAEAEVAYVGLGSHLGTPVGQNAAGDRLTHIRDERLPDTGGKVRLYRTRERQDFHCDGADVIGLLCLHRARTGGESRIVSSGAVYNELLTQRPDLLEELYQPLCWDRQDDVRPDQHPWFRLAPLTDLPGGPRLFYIGWYIRDAQRHADVPRLTDAQLEAMALLESIANDPSFHLEMAFQPGDVQLLNNGRVLHAREAFEDDDDPDERRHLLRLWLAAHRFASVEDGLRGGVAAPR